VAFEDLASYGRSPLDGLPRLIVIIGIMFAVLTWRSSRSRRREDVPPKREPPDAAAPPRPKPAPAAVRLEASLAVPARSIPELLAVTPLEHVVDTLRVVIAAPGKTMVLFRHGTVVVLSEASDDPIATASAIMRRARVMPGGSAGDFGTLQLQDGRGWMVTCDWENVFTFLSPDELENAGKSPLIIGFIGRSKRHLDATEAHAVHVETLPPTRE